ncbi:hypothetical protein ACQ4M3_29030 [Leptolyngbya sp. AN03gr2]|uniref:hypothetical protein n=1 Tax=unclassified Leptolyngbya TaxID=2650499 RepID=UPI003D322ED7
MIAIRQFKPKLNCPKKQSSNQRLHRLFLVAIAGAGLNLTLNLYSLTTPYQAQLREYARSNLQALTHVNLNTPLTNDQVPLLFEGGVNSIVARGTGTAEATRTPDGNITENWKGHTDPGDGEWNIGTFSYNANRDKTRITTPKEADRYYLEKLKIRSGILLTQSHQANTRLTLEEWLNAIDLATQAPEAALGWSDGQNPGFISNLISLKRQGMRGQKAIVAARVASFRNIKTRRYETWTDRSGLEHDQTRRLVAIAESVSVWQQQQQHINRVAFKKPTDFSTIEKQNPYGYQQWQSLEEYNKALYWQMGAWSALNNRPAISNFPTYEEGYKFTDTAR